MAEPDNATQAQTSSINLRILQPSTGTLETALNFSDIPLASTVRELKSKIQNALPSNPPTESLRLIYLGRVCLEDQTLRQTLGRNLQPDQDYPYVLHLVVQDPRNARLAGPSFAQPRSSSLPPNARDRAVRQPSPGPFSIPITRNTPQSQGQQPGRLVHVGMPPTLGHPEMVNNRLNQHFAQFSQGPQLAFGQGPGNIPGGNHGIVGMTAHQQQLLHQQALQTQQQELLLRQNIQAHQERLNWLQAQLQQLYAGPGGILNRGNHQQGPQRSQSHEALRAHAGQISATIQNNAPQNGTFIPQVNLYMQTNPLSPAGHSFLPNNTTPWAYSTDGSTGTLHGSGVTPQGHRYSLMMRASTGSSVPNAAIHSGAQVTAALLGIPTPTIQPGTINLGQVLPPTIPPTDQPNSGAQSRAGTPSLRGVSSAFMPPMPASPTRTASEEALQSESERAIQNLQNLDQQPLNAASIPTQGDGARSNSSVSVAPIGSTVLAGGLARNQAQVYVVTNGSGEPQALLVGPSGPSISNPLPGDVYHSLAQSGLPADRLGREFHSFLVAVWQSTIAMMRDAHHHNRRLQTARPPATHSGVNTGQPFQQPESLTAQIAALRATVGNQQAAAAAANGAAGAQPAAAQPPAPAQRREPDEMRDFLAPVVRNLWLIIRIAGLLYFIMGSNRALWRPLILAVAIMVIYAIQGGAFGDVVGERAEWVRRYFNRVIGVEEQNRNGPARGATNGQNTTQQQPNGATVRPTPEDAARRLVQGRRAQDASWVRQQFHSVERTLALFVASLWPGIGEQAVRLQEEREAAARRAVEEEQRRRDEEAAAAAAPSENTNDNQQVEEPTHYTELAAAGSSRDAAVCASGVEAAGGSSASLERVNKGKQKASDDEGHDETTSVAD